MSSFDYAKLATSVLGQLDPAVAISIRHNLAILRAIHWGARGVLSSNIEFDPRTKWWYPPERRSWWRSCRIPGWTGQPTWAYGLVDSQSSSPCTVNAEVAHSVSISPRSHLSISSWRRDSTVCRSDSGTAHEVTVMM
jgi:hypothetical protein